MSTGIFASYDTQDLNRIAAKGILEKLRTIRQKINVNLTARRIIWELIQNAKDNVLICQNQNTSLKIAIELTNNSFTFSHNNGFLTNENIRGLIRRYSSSDKDRDYNSLKDPPLTTGRFGTGFMTTHLLSEKVTVKGIYKDENCEFRQFTLPINRTGTNEKDIINSIESSFSEVEYSIINSPKINKDPYEFETKFIYELDDEGYKYSLIAIDDFNLCIGPTLINLVSVDEVKVKIGETTTIYKLKEKENYKKAELNFSITELQKNENTLENNKFLVIDNDKIRLIFLIDKVEDRYLIKIFDSKVPRLFLDFPLVGTEKINIPFIINSRFFEPTEERDGVSLTGSDDRDTKVNSSILIEANNLFKLFLDLVCSDDKWSNLFNLARFNLPEEDRWINLEWYKSSILKPIRDKLIKSKIVETATGSRKSIKDINDRDQIYFPYDTKEENRMILWELSKLIFPDYIPIREDVNAWYEIIWEDCYKLNVEKLAEKISKFDSIDELKTELKLSEEEVFGWLNRFYELIFNDKSFVNKKKFNDYKIFPNQNGKFSNLSDLSIDDDIEEELKNVLKILDVDIRNKLLHKKVVFDQEDLLKEIKINIKDQEWVVDYINKSLEKIKSNEVIDYLISLFSNDPDFPPERELIYNFNRIIFKNRIPEKKSIKKWSKSIWKNADKLRISDLVIEISNRKNIDGLVKLLGEDSEKTLLCWLQKFIDFLREYNFEEILNTLESPIIPNQNNVFKAKDKLFVQDTNLSEELKNISRDLGYDIREELLHKDISLSLPNNRIRTNEHLADEISKRLKSIMKDADQRNKYEHSLQQLYFWMTQNPETASNVFGEIYDKKFLLMSDEIIIDNFNKAEKLDNLISESGFTYEEIMAKICNKENQDKNKTDIVSSSLIFEEEFNKVEKDFLDQVSFDNSSFFPEGENLTFREKLLQLILSSKSRWAGYIYHFTSLENAIKIIKERKFLSRNRAKFKDSAGASFISNTDSNIKNFVRFYFRPLTPTQYYNEGLGKTTKNGDLPQCPVMIFFKFELKEILENDSIDCYVSNGNLRHYPITNYGNSYEFLKTFNIKYLFCNHSDSDARTFLNASQQEFIIKNEFDFSNLQNFQIICRNNADRDSLVYLLGNDNLIVEKIIVDDSYYYGNNGFVSIDYYNNTLRVSLPYRNIDESIKIISKKIINSLTIEDKIKFQKSLEITTHYNTAYEVYYINESNNNEWLVYIKRE